MAETAPSAATRPPAAGPPQAPPTPGLTTGATVLAAIVALYFGADIFVPFALAVLLSFLLAPPVAWLRHLHVPRVPAVLLAVTFAFLAIAALSTLVGSQIAHLAENLPNYQYTMQEKIRAIRSSAPQGGTIDRAIKALGALGREISAPAEPAEGTAEARKEDEPPTVRIERPPPEPLDVIGNVLGPLLGPIGTAGIVVVFVVFILLERDDIRDRFIRLAGGDLPRTTEALNEAATRVSRYLLMQLIINATYGIPIGIGLYLIGVPNALLWGLLATLLRFVPYLGPFIAALLPLVLAFAVDPGWNMLLWSLALFLGMELISNNLIEPWLYGSSTGLSPVAVILAAIFWTTLWGPIGLILATPLTVCLVVMGRYVPQLEFFSVMLGNEPVLSPEERLYQRLLAGNTEEAIELAEEEIEQSSLPHFYDHVGLPALRLAENDRRRGLTEREHRKVVADGARTLVRELAESSANGDEERADTREEDGETVCWLGTPALCIAGRGELDHAAAAMLAHALEIGGTGARHLPASAIIPEAIGTLDLAGVEVVCVSYLEAAPQPYARFVCRRLKRRAPHTKVVLGLWNLAPGSSPQQIATSVGADAAADTLAGLIDSVRSLAGPATAPAMTPPPLPLQERERLEALYACGILERGNRERLDQLACGVAKAFDVPIALVSLVDESCQTWVGACGLPDELERVRQAPRETSICGHVVALGGPLLIEDTARDPRFAGNPFLRSHGIRFYAGAPLRVASGHVIGSLCLIDTKPRRLDARDLGLLQVIADQLIAQFAGPVAGSGPDRADASSDDKPAGTRPAPASGG